MFRTYELEPEIAVNGIRGGGRDALPTCTCSLAGGDA